MANTFTTNLNLTKPEVGADTDAWGGHLNTDLDTLDGIFAAAGTGTSVGLNVGSGKTLNVAGTFISPTIIGGTAASSTLTLESTSGVGTSDAILFKTGSQSERMRIDTSGNVGIGMTPSSTGGRLQVNAAANNASARITGNANGMSVLNQDGLTVYTNLSSGAVDTTLVAGNNAATYMAFGIHNGTSYSERMRIDSSGNVGIATNSPSKKLEVYAGSNSLQILSVVRNDNTGTGVAAIGFNTSGSASSEATSTKAGIGLIRGSAFGGGALAFYNNNSGAAGDFTTADEKMRIDTSGNLLVGTTTLTDGSKLVIRPATNQSGLTVQQNGAGDYCIHLNAVNNGGTFYYQYFVAGATNVGSISSNTTTTSYNTSSDYRLKENVASMTIGLATIAALRPVTYDWKIDGSSGEGFIAHELQAVIPLAVSGEKDAVNEDGSIKSQGVDYSKIVVHLVAALQELKTEFDAYKASHA